MTESLKSSEIILSSLHNLPPKHHANVKLLCLGKHNVATMKQKPAEIL